MKIRQSVLGFASILGVAILMIGVVNAKAQTITITPHIHQCITKYVLGALNGAMMISVVNASALNYKNNVNTMKLQRP